MKLLMVIDEGQLPSQEILDFITQANEACKLNTDSLMELVSNIECMVNGIETEDEDQLDRFDILIKLLKERIDGPIMVDGRK